MTRKFSSIAILSLLLVAFMGMSAFAAKEPVTKRVADGLIYKSVQYSFPDEHLRTEGVSERDVPGQDLGVTAASASPGAVIGNTWYDYQHNGTMGRMVSTDFGTMALVHFSWMYLPGRTFDARSYAYWVYNLTLSSSGTLAYLMPEDEYGGYVNLDVTGDNRAIVGGHNYQSADPLQLNAPEFYWDFSEGSSYFAANDRLPRAQQEYLAQKTDQEVIWPKFAYAEGPTDTVLHVIAQAALDDAADPQAIYYFRRLGGDDNPSSAWDYPPYIVDTIYDLSHDIVANDDGKVGMAWTANLPCELTDPDTASGYECRQFVQWENDVYYQISNDYGVTWLPRVNVTNYRDIDGLEDGYRAYTDLSALLDAAGNLHVAWGTSFFPADALEGGGVGFYRGRIFHWSENQPYVRTAHSADWDQTECSPGAWNLNASKMSVSECNGRLYMLFTMFNDGPAGIFDDCADEGNPGFPSGAANGDLYVVISGDGGLTWDAARNLTNSRTPGCDSVGGVGGPCDNDMWASMAAFGTNYALASGDNATEVVVPTGGSDNGWYLDVQYINDKSAGGIVQDEGTWQEVDVKWFRLACVEEVTAPSLLFSPIEVAFPEWTKHGVPYDISLKLENLGNTGLNYSVTPVEDAGAYSGWLGTSGFSGFVDFGVNNTETATVTLNAGGVVNDPGTIVNLLGRLVFTSDAPSSPDTFDIDFIVADTLYPPEIDTVSTPCLSLVVLNNGECGNQGPGKVNMDYYDAGDCDTNATVYLYDGSPVIGWLDGADTVMNWSVFGNNYITDVGFYPTSNSESYTDANHELYTSTFVTRDTSIAFEKTYFAPNDAGNCDFIIQCLKVYSGDGASHSGLTVGEAIDWDIPADSGANNGSGFNETAGLIYQYGGEYHQDDTGANIACQDNDLRYGGIKFLAMYNKTAGYTDLGMPNGAYTKDNPTYVFGNDNGFLPGELFENMQEGGYSTYLSAAPESLYTDLHMVMTYLTDYTLNPGETLLVYTALVVEENGGVSAFTASAGAAYDWYCANIISDPPGCGCCQLRGDVDASGAINVSDLTYLVARLFQGGPPPPCEDEGDVDGSGAINVSDLTYLVARLFQGGPPPPPC